MERFSEYSSRLITFHHVSSHLDQNHEIDCDTINSPPSPPLTTNGAHHHVLTTMCSQPCAHHQPKALTCRTPRCLPESSPPTSTCAGSSSTITHRSATRYLLSTKMNICSPTTPKNCPPTGTLKKNPHSASCYDSEYCTKQTKDNNDVRREHFRDLTRTSLNLELDTHILLT